MITTTKKFRILAIVDDVNACECCGKSDLLRTVAIENSETGEIKYFGTTCAMQPAKGFGIEKKELSDKLSDFKFAQQRMWPVARRIYKERGGKMIQVMVMDKKLGREFPENRFTDEPMFDAICKELGGVAAFMPKPFAPKGDFVPFLTF